MATKNPRKSCTKINAFWFFFDDGVFRFDVGGGRHDGVDGRVDGGVGAELPQPGLELGRLRVFLLDVAFGDALSPPVDPERFVLVVL